VLGIMLFQHAFSFLEFGYASALAWVMFAILLVLTVLQLRITRQRSWEASRGLS
jgi:multiple sugar transport system permease protein